MQRNNTGSISEVHTYVRPKKKTKKSQNDGNRMKEKKQKKERKKERKKEKQNRNDRALKAQAKRPEGRILLFAVSISPMICPVDGLTERQHQKTKRTTRQEEGQRQV